MPSGILILYLLIILLETLSLFLNTGSLFKVFKVLFITLLPVPPIVLFLLEFKYLVNPINSGLCNCFICILPEPTFKFSLNFTNLFNKNCLLL